MAVRGQMGRYWTRFWMRYSGTGSAGRLAARFAALTVAPYKGRVALARMNRRGYIAPGADIKHRQFRFGDHVFIDDRVSIFQSHKGGRLDIGDRVHIFRDTVLEQGQGGNITIGADTCIQPRCQLSAYVGSIVIGCGVQIAPGCAFYPYNHATEAGATMREQPMVSRGDIVIGDDVWLGYGVVVLDGVRIGKGAVIGANAVVTHDIPDGAIAAGIPARVLRMRDAPPQPPALEIA